MKAFFSKICGRRKKNRAATALQNLSGKDAKKGDEAAPAELPGEAAGQRDEAAIQEFYRKEAEENKTKLPWYFLPPDPGTYPELSQVPEILLWLDPQGALYYQVQSRYKDLITPVEELDPFLGSNLKQKILRYIASQLNKRQNRSENLRIGRFEVRGVDDSFEKITKIHVLYTIKDDNTRILSASGYAASQRSASSKPTKYDLRTLNKHGSAPRPVRLPHTFPSLSHENRRKSRPLPLNVTPAPEVTPGASTRPAAAQRPLS